MVRVSRYSLSLDEHRAPEERQLQAQSSVVGRQLVEEPTRCLGRTGTVAYLILHG